MYNCIRRYKEITDVIRYLQGVLGRDVVVLGVRTGGGGGGETRRRADSASSVEEGEMEDTVSG